MVTLEMCQIWWLVIMWHSVLGELHLPTILPYSSTGYYLFAAPNIIYSDIIKKKNLLSYFFMRKQWVMNKFAINFVVSDYLCFEYCVFNSHKHKNFPRYFKDQPFYSSINPLGQPISIIFFQILSYFFWSCW